MVESASTAKTTFQACGITNGSTYVTDKTRAFNTIPACDTVSMSLKHFLTLYGGFKQRILINCTYFLCCSKFFDSKLPIPLHLLFNSNAFFFFQR